jgi:alpha-tubulin suppressor-like RCC1 family protein
MPVTPFYIRLVTLIAGMSACLLTGAEFQIDSIASQAGRSEVRVIGETGFYHVLWRGDSITDIRLVTDLALSSGAQSLLTDTNATNSAQFYRVEKVRLTSLRDTDGDGINDAWELLYRHPGAALNANDADEDHDGNGVADRIDALRESLREGAIRGRPVLAAGEYYTLAIQTDGTLWGWGDNLAGELGAAGFTETNTPTRISDDTNWIAVSARNNTSYGLKSDGTLWAWGQWTTGAVLTPTQIGTNTDWIGLPSGEPHRNPTALRADGSRWQFIQSFTNSQPYGVSNSWAAVADADALAGLHWAIEKNGTLWLGTSVFDTNPVWTSVSAANAAVLALRTNGTLWAWVPTCCNFPGEGQLGLGAISPMVPTQVGTDTWAAAVAGYYHSVGIKSDGSLWWWGLNIGFETDGATPARSAVPVQFGTNTDWIGITSGGRHTVALRADGTVWTFGFNDLGMSRSGAVVLVKSPVQIGSNYDWSHVAAGASYSFGLKTNGTLWAWGLNAYGVLGANDFSSSPTPRQVPGSNWISVSGGGDHTTALQGDGTLWVWGKYIYNSGNDDVFTNVPTRLSLDSDWTKISAGFQHSLALKTDGSLWSWGRNANGELGTGVGKTSTPTRVGSAFWTNISAGYYNSLGVQQTSGSLWFWGQDIARPVPRQTPEQVSPFDFDWKAVANAKTHSSFATHALALKRNGTLWGWGSDSRGQLGGAFGGGIMSNPTRIGISTNWWQIAVGDLFSGALQIDGTLWMSGFNFYGQLGFGTRTDTNAFTRVGTETNWTSVAAGRRHMLALKGDGSIWAWGDNGYGQCAQPALFEPSPVAGNNWGPPHR